MRFLGRKSLLPITGVIFGMLKRPASLKLESRWKFLVKHWALGTSRMAADIALNTNSRFLPADKKKGPDRATKKVVRCLFYAEL